MTNNPNQTLIRDIQVRNLFGYFNYDICFTKEGNLPGQLLLLYGDNGAGKTTILNIIYHLLSPEPYANHRSNIGNVKFSSFAIRLGENIIIEAKRKGHDLIGDYEIVFSRGTKIIVRWRWNPKTNRSSKGSKSESEYDYNLLCKELKSLNIFFHYLSDTRKVESSSCNTGNYQETAFHDISRLDEEMMEKREILLKKSISNPDILLESAIEGAMEWFRQQAIKGANVGYSSIDAIYKEITKRIISKQTTINALSYQYQQARSIVNTLIELKERNTNFAIFGLTSEMDIDVIINTLLKSKREHLSLLNTLFEPYIGSIKARLEALQEAQKAMQIFITTINNFYSHKSVSLHLKDGIVITSASRDCLKPEMLSSGERQLLLLLCNAIAARDRATIFIIDEPEISLNVKWQRQLVSALLNCLSPDNSQLIMATHSIELFTKFKKSVVSLTNLESGKK